MAYPTRKEKNVYALISPFVLAWTGLNFWWLATEGGMPVRSDGGQEWTNTGMMFWITFVLYVVLTIAALVALAAFFIRLINRDKAA